MKDTQVEAPKKHHEGSDNIVVPGGLFGCSSLSSSGIRWSTAESSSLSLCTSHQPRSLFFLFFFSSSSFPQTHTLTHSLTLTPISLNHPLSSSSASLPLSQLFSAPAEETFFLPSLLFSNHFLQETTLHHHIHHCLGALSIVPGLISSP